jgi:C-terminal processing protease CtpA/Prc
VPTGRAIEPDIAYLRIPLGVSPTFLDEYARAGHDLFRELDQASVQGWILDFRENYGGSYYPMLVTVVPLLPDGVLFGFKDRHAVVELTTLHDQTLQLGEGQVLDLLPDSYTLQSSSAKIAILIDPTTSSAGELTAIMFKGLPNARFFGDDSNGLTTANLSLNLFDGSSLVLARSFEVDREGTVYEAGLQPDEYIAKNEQTYLLDEDPVIQAAVSWISSQ